MLKNYQRYTRNNKMKFQKPTSGIDPLTTRNTKAPRGRGIKPILREIRSEWSANA